MAFQGPGFPLIDVIADKDVTIAERNAMRVDAQNVALQRAIDKKIISNNTEAVVRSLRPQTDLTWGANANQSWLTAALIAGTAQFPCNGVAVPANQVVVIYNVSVLDAAPGIAEIRFGIGAAGQINSMVFQANLQHVYVQQEVTGYFSKIIGYDPLDVMVISLLPFIAAAGGQIVILRGYVAERTGQVISGPVT